MYNPKSMLKKLKASATLDFDLDGIIDKLLDKVFGGVDAALGLDKTLGTDSKKAGVPGITLSTKDIEIFETRNLEVFAMTKEDFDKSNFDNAVFVSNTVPVDKDAEPVIVRFRPRPLLADYKLGTIDRYVLFDIRNKGIIEVSKDDYIEFRALRYKRSYVISWYIFGKADDYQIKKYIYPGVRNNNIDVLVQAESIIPGISDYFEDKIEYLLESLDDYSGDPEVINLPEPEDPISEEVAEQFEDLGFGPETLDIPALPKLDLDFADDLAGDFTAADEALGNVSSSIEDLIATQDQVTAEQEGLFAQQESRLRKIEDDQEAQNRKNAFTEIITDLTTETGKRVQRIINMDSGAKRKKKRRRLDQERDETNAKLLIPKLLNPRIWKNDKDPDDPNYNGGFWAFTPKELVEWINDSSLNTRMKVRLTSKELYTNWTRDNKNFYGRTRLYTITPDVIPPDEDQEIPDPTLNYDAIKLTGAERRTAIALLSGRSKRNGQQRGVIQKIYKEQKIVFRDDTGRYPTSTDAIRRMVQDRYNAYRRLEQSNQTGKYSKRNRMAARRKARDQNYGRKKNRNRRG